MAIGVASLMVLAASCSVGERSDGADTASRSEGAHPRHETAASQYLDIAEAGNERLETDIDGLTGRDRDRLAAAKADLRDAAATERLFDRRLLDITFSPAINKIAEALSAVNQARAQLSADASTSPTRSQLHGFEVSLSAANARVELQVRRIRAALHLPPPSTS